MTIQFFNSLAALNRVKPADCNVQTLRRELCGSHGSEWLPRGGAETIRRQSTDGWPDGLKIVKEYGERMQGQLKDTTEKTRRKMRWSDQGDEIDLDRMRAGRLECWRKPERTPKRIKRHKLRIVVNISFNANINWRDTMWGSAMLLKLIDHAERNRVSTEVIVINKVLGLVSLERNETTRTICVLKPFGRKLVPEAMIAGTYAGFLRVNIFCAQASLEDKISPSFGVPRSVEKSDLPVRWQGPDTIIINSREMLREDSAVECWKKLIDATHN